MTSLRPGAGQEGPYTQGAYEPDGTFAEAVEQLADPLNDPLPGQHTSPWFRTETAPADDGSPQTPQTPRAPQTPQAAAQEPAETPGEWYDPEGYRRDWYGQQGLGRHPRRGRSRGPR